MADMAALASRGISFVFTYHAGTMKKERFLFDLVIWFYEHTFLNLSCRIAVKVVCPSHFVIISLLKKYQSKSAVVSPGVDLDLFRPDEASAPSRNTVLFIARYINMYKMKGFFTLLEAARSLPDITFKVIGEPISVELKNIVFLGTKTVQETVKEMQNCTLLTLPSLAHAESFGMVLIEAMACGKPVIGTRIGGIPEVIIDEIDGLIVPPENPERLAEAIKRIISDADFANFLAKNGIAKIGLRYTWPIKVEETKKLFEKILLDK